jgi:hypothetical protein
VAGGLAARGAGWATVRDRLRSADRVTSPGTPDDYDAAPNLFAALEAGVTALPDDVRDRYRELAVFDGRDAIPVDVAGLLWSLDEPAAEELLVDLAGRSLIQINPSARTFTLHALQFDYLVRISAAEAVAELHQALATRLLDHGGGGAESFGSTPIDLYGLHHLADHMLAGGRPDLLHRLLAASTSSRPGTNVWYAAHDRAGTVEAYLRDVDRARTVAAAHDSLDLEIRYLLIRASIVNIAGSISSRLLEALVREGVWAVPRALAYARSIAGDYDREEALRALLPHLPEADRPAVATEILAAAAASGIDIVAAHAVVELAPYLPEEQRDGFLRERLAEARGKDELERASELRHLAYALPADRRAEVLAEALAAARDTDDYFADLAATERAAIYVELAKSAAPDARGDLLGRAFEAIDRDDVGFVDLHVALDCLCLMPAGSRDRERRLRWTLKRVRRLRSVSEQCDLLVALGTLPGDRRLMEEALATAARQGSELRYVVGKLPEDLRSTAADLCRRLVDPADRSGALLALAGGAPAVDRESLLADALEAARRITDRAARAEALVGVAGLTGPDRARPLVVEALAATRKVDDATAVAPVLAALGARLPRHVGGIAIRAAVATARTARFGSNRVEVARHLTGPVRDELAEAALELCETGDVRYPPELIALARVLPVRCLSRLRSYLSELEQKDPTWPTVGGEVWAVLAGRLPADALPGAMDRFHILFNGLKAERAIRAMEPRMSQSQVMQLIAESGGDWATFVAALLIDRLPPRDRAKVERQARKFAGRVDEPDLRAQLLRLIASATAGPGRATAIARALGAAREIPPNRDLAAHLAEVAALLTGEARRDVMAEAARAAIAGDAAGRRTLAETASAMAPVGWATFWRPLLTDAAGRGRFALADVLQAAVPEIAIGGDDLVGDVLISVFQVVEWFP